MLGNSVFLEVILYVNDQQASAHFYQGLLGREPVLDVPGMTEFMLTDDTKLGLMPSKGIARILGSTVPHPHEGDGVPRCELYLGTPEPGAMYDKALELGATAVSKAAPRNWGETVAYVADPDGHIVAFAQHPS